ncbi:MAG: saccharopine dehydrogenase family protein [Polyangiaceae bacterium]
MSKVLIVGAGGVGNVVAHKCAQVPEVFTEILLASRTVSRCEKIAADVKELQGRTIQTAAVNADDVEQMRALIRSFKPDLVLNVALPYQDLPIMDACLAEKVDYLDTANYEPKDVAKFEYKWQWAYQDRYRQSKIMALLGSGFDPGVTNVYCAYAQKHLFDEIETVDILDCNGGSHGHAFATNFNPEINIREITQRGRYWEEGEWKETDPLSVKMDYDFPGVGVRKAYLLYHEELESLVQNIKGLKRIRFWMTFGEQYLTHLRVLENVGMTRIDPVDYKGTKVVPIEFLKCLLPDPSTLGAGYTGKTSIGCEIVGKKNGKPRKVFIYNICDHAECWKEVRAQAVSYTTGVPAMIGAKMMLTGKWKGEGVFNMEQLDPDPFMEALNQHGLPWEIREG